MPLFFEPRQSETEAIRSRVRIAQGGESGGERVARIRQRQLPKVRKNRRASARGAFGVGAAGNDEIGEFHRRRVTQRTHVLGFERRGSRETREVHLFRYAAIATPPA